MTEVKDKCVRKKKKKQPGKYALVIHLVYSLSFWKICDLEADDSKIYMVNTVQFISGRKR